MSKKEERMMWGGLGLAIAMFVVVKADLPRWLLWVAFGLWLIPAGTLLIALLWGDTSHH